MNTRAAFPDLARVEALLRERGLDLGRKVVVQSETESTNDDAKRGAKAGEPDGTVWVAETQTRGRGRQGRAWLSAAGENLLFSVLVRLSCVPSRVPPVSLAIGLAVRDAVARAVGDDEAVLVKWPNDVLVRRSSDGELRKVAGILVESVVSGSRIEQLVIGVGLNVHARELPDSIAGIATSIALERDGRSPSTPLDRAEVLADVLSNLDRDVRLVAHRGLGLIHARLARHDALRGLAVEGDDGELRGTARGIDLEGRLLVEKDDGTVVRVSSGEMRIFRV